MIESDSERLIAVTGGKVAPPPTVGGKSLPLDSDSFLKRIAYVITYHAPCRHAHTAGSESAPSWPWRPWPQKGRGAGFHFYFHFHEHRGDSQRGWDCAKPAWQLVQFAAAGYRRHTLGSGYESGGIRDQRGLWIGSGWIGGRRSPQDQCDGLISSSLSDLRQAARSRIAASSRAAPKGLMRGSVRDDIFSAMQPEGGAGRYAAGERGPGRRPEMPGWRPNTGRRTDSPRQRTGYVHRPSSVP
jgi:hypothetical protein